MKKLLIFCLTAVFAFTLLSPIGWAAEAAEAADKAAGKVNISSGWLNVRDKPSTGGKTLKTLKKDSFITLINKSGNWWRVEYADGKYGYCHENYITKLSSSNASVKLTSGSLNVRSGAGTKYSIVGSLKNGQRVIILSKSGDWSRVLYSGVKTGYVSSKYLKATATGEKAISLNVPDFKQTDSRWANKIVGDSGKTFAKIGCATTGIAIMESFRQGKTIYPDKMAENLRYTPSGNVYWPSNFIVTLNEADYLKEILNILKSGKPVLLGRKNSSGSQHWVVIKGFSGGEIIPANFMINDPGSNTRKTLADFIAKYPTFYKYFVYR